MDPLKYFDSVDLRSLRKEAQGFHVYRGLRYDIAFEKQKNTFLYKSYDLQQTHRKRNRFETLPDYMVGEPYQRGESSQDIEYSPPARITSLWNAFLEWLFQRERYELDLYLPNSMLPTAFDKNQLTAQQMSDILPEGALPSVTSLDDPAAVPLVVHVHGGGWMRGRHDIEWRGGPVASATLARHGIPTAAVSYRLSAPSTVATLVYVTLVSFFLSILLFLLEMLVLLVVSLCGWAADEWTWLGSPSNTGRFYWQLYVYTLAGLWLLAALISFTLESIRHAVRHPAHCYDVADATRWMLTHARDINSALRIGGVCLSGHSAGGHIASFVGVDAEMRARAGLSVAGVEGLLRRVATANGNDGDGVEGNGNDGEVEAVQTAGAVGAEDVVTNRDATPAAQSTDAQSGVTIQAQAPTADSAAAVAIVTPLVAPTSPSPLSPASPASPTSPRVPRPQTTVPLLAVLSFSGLYNLRALSPSWIVHSAFYAFYGSGAVGYSRAALWAASPARVIEDLGRAWERVRGCGAADGSQRVCVGDLRSDESNSNEQAPVDGESLVAREQRGDVSPYLPPLLLLNAEKDLGLGDDGQRFAAMAAKLVRRQLQDLRSDDVTAGAPASDSVSAADVVLAESRSVEEISLATSDVPPLVSHATLKGHSHVSIALDIDRHDGKRPYVGMVWSAWDAWRKYAIMDEGKK